MDRELLDDEPFFRFDNDDEEAAVMDQILDGGDIDVDPITPYGSAGPSAPSAAAHGGDGAGRLHLSSAQIWQNPDHPPDNASPPPLTYSPSPRTTSSFKHRHQDTHRQQRQRFSSSHNNSQHQLSRHDTAQELDQIPGDLSSPISNLNLNQQFLDQQRHEDGAHRHRRSREKETGNVPARSRHGHEEHLEGRVSRQHPSHVATSRLVGSASRQDHEDPELAAPHDLDQYNHRMLHQQSALTGEPQQDVRSASLIDHDEPDLQVVEPQDCQEYELIPADEVHEMMYNGDEESRITAQKLKDQIVHAVTQNGKVCYMVLQATAQWWRSPEMSRRKRAAGRKVYDVSSQVVSGAGHVILTSTPVGRICDSVSANVTAFKAAPFTYAMQGLGVMKGFEAASTLPSTDTSLPKAPTDLMGLGLGEGPESGPVIADDDGFGSEFDEDACLGLGMFDEQ